MWTEYVNSLAKNARVNFIPGDVPTADVNNQVIGIPQEFVEGFETWACVKHEVAHLLFSKDYQKTIDQLKIKHSNGLPPISNAIEDVRVQDELGKKFIGIKQDFLEYGQMKASNSGL